MTFLNQTNIRCSGWQLLHRHSTTRYWQFPVQFQRTVAYEDSLILKISGRSAGLVYGYRAQSQTLVPSNGYALSWG